MANVTLIFEISPLSAPPYLSLGIGSKIRIFSLFSLFSLSSLFSFRFVVSFPNKNHIRLQRGFLPAILGDEAWQYFRVQH